MPDDLKQGHSPRKGRSASGLHSSHPRGLPRASARLSEKCLKLWASQEPFLESANHFRGKKQAPNYMLIFLEFYCLLDFEWVIFLVMGNLGWIIFYFWIGNLVRICLYADDFLYFFQLFKLTSSGELIQMT